MTEAEKAIFKFAFLAISAFCLVACDRAEKRISHYANGQVEIEAFFKDGVPHGKEVDYYPSGKVKGEGFFVNGRREGKGVSYYENDNPKSIITYKSGVMVDTAKYYYENGTLETLVPYKNGYKNGWVSFYDKEGRLSEIHEYFSQGSKEYQNQWIKYDERGNIRADSSNYITLSSNSDTIQLGKQYKLFVKLETPTMGKESQMEVHIANFDDEYRLGINSVPDTVKSKSFISTVTIEPKQRGKHRIRGRVVNFVVNDSLEAQPIWLKKEMHIYFTKDYFVQ